MSHRNDTVSLKHIPENKSIGIALFLFESKISNKFHALRYYLLLQHPADQEERVIKRFLTYHEHIEDVTDFYERIVQHINADQDPHTVFECIESMIVNPLPRKE